MTGIALVVIPSEREESFPRLYFVVIFIWEGLRRYLQGDESGKPNENLEKSIPKKTVDFDASFENLE